MSVKLYSISDSVVFHFAETLCLDEAVLTMIILYFQIHSALNWHGTMQYIRYSEPCSKSSELYDKSHFWCYSVTVKIWDNLVCLFQFTLCMIYSAETSVMGRLCITRIYVSAWIDKWTVSLSNAHFKIAFSMSEI